MSYFLGAVRGMDSPRQWAAGLALGLLGGCIPVHSLLTVLVAITLVLCGANLLTGAVGWGLGWLAASGLAGPFEQLGYALLTAPRLQAVWVLLVESPGGCWCHWNNTLVAGSFVGGAMIAAPVFLVALFAAQGIQRRLNRFFSRFPVTRWLVRDEARSTQSGINPT